MDQASVKEPKDRKWFGVRIIYRFIISGEPVPSTIDAFYTADYAAYEESIILVQASSFDEAYAAAEHIGRQNESTYLNRYHQTVTQSYYDYIDCFWLPNSTIKSGTEVYSNIVSTTRSITAEAFIESIPLSAEGPKHMLMHK
ncbi:DUF4288 domain-containing protein [Hymenobacter jeollabukensis]|uniref:DUF4288 domain-containing protein n=1 Tax=Hymenobacter jeollabukensis TaxID=2025313 RepID=A0A5R8WL66_9BACT|nr:DUF4288 domain-containing protein [Hymenobacter jeollabukensis]TLM89828.1 DUF4288 domain-containing protein [Hymenobacter jeollabukensis]